MGFDAIIIGGGPAGSAAAISMSQRGARVLVLEEKRMPRGKLCGEFITPECFPTLERLGVMQRMLAAGAQKISRVSLVAESGKSVESCIPQMSDSDNQWAMSLSRSRFDQILFEGAREAGAECLEGYAASGCKFDDDYGTVEALSLKEGARVTFKAPIIIDASGRNSRWMLGKQERLAGHRGSRLYALKAHFTRVNGITDQVELYFFREGYGGFSRVEDNLVNLCFIVGESALKQAGGNASEVVKNTLMKNPLAAERLCQASVVGKWYSTGPLTFGRRRLSRDNVIAIGDASGMIDPFTGTGLQIAVRTGEMAAGALIEALGRSGSFPYREEHYNHQSERRMSLYESIQAGYRDQYEREFHQRMKVAGLLRAAAFSPATSRILAIVLERAPRLTNVMLRATRSGHPSTGPSE
ncbi:MAG TPA: NAD(P)/FAD-dependent oxidoreductase [Blastocatellia bacterium]|nr:NAD(P)/FAD-dependent oxidoreductase [Blastocatellia bacterium]